MDLEEQGSIQRLVETGDRERMVVLLGTPTPGSTVMVALTLTEGDPSDPASSRSGSAVSCSGRYRGETVAAHGTCLRRRAGLAGSR